MVKRKIIKIIEDKCNGCGECIPNCPEGALKVIDGKVRLISDLFCDGLGACIGHCPEGAISVEEREAQPYDEKKVMENIVKAGKNTIKAHFEHLLDHGEKKFYNQAVDFLKEKNIENPCSESSYEKASVHGCPGAAVKVMDKKTSSKEINLESELIQWPVQLHLVPVNAPYFNDADLLVAADCVPFSYANFHQKLLRGKSLLIGCPKLDDISTYKEKLTQIFKQNEIKSVTTAIMEVPCCYGLYATVEQAIKDSNKDIPLYKKIIGINGDIKS